MQRKVSIGSSYSTLCIFQIIMFLYLRKHYVQVYDKTSVMKYISIKHFEFWLGTVVLIDVLDDHHVGLDACSRK